jgi:excinuclease ABC subunit B
LNYYLPNDQIIFIQGGLYNLTYLFRLTFLAFSMQDTPPLFNREFKLASDFSPAGDQPKAIKKIINGLKKKKRKQTVVGVTGSGKTFVMAHVINTSQRPALIMAPNKTLAAQLYREMKGFFPNNAVEYFVSYYDYYQPEAYLPASNTLIEKDASINQHIEQMRLSATKSVLERKDCIIISSVSAIYGLGDPKQYFDMVLHLSCDHRIEIESIVRQLVTLQYTRNELTLERGQFRVIGDTIDIFPAESETEAIRVQLLDDEIESIAYFDPLTGRITRTTPRVTIFPKSHYVTGKARQHETIKAIQAELKERLAYFESAGRLVEHQRLKERCQYDLEMLNELGYCNGIENYSRHLSGRDAGQPPPTLLDYLPDNTIVMIDESHVTLPQIRGMYRGDHVRKTTLVDYGFRLPSALDNRPLRFDEFITFDFQTLFISATPGDFEEIEAEQKIELLVRPTGLLDPPIEVRPAENQVDDVCDEIRKRLPLKERILVTTLTKKMAEHLTEFLQEQKINARYLHADIDTVTRVELLRDLRLGVFDVLVGINLLREGLDLPEVSLVAILDADREGFLRNARSLIQTSGRAARHINGKAIFYADRITNSMQLAIDETKRRRTIQKTYNDEHDIAPKSIIKKVHDLFDSDQKLAKDSMANEAIEAHLKSILSNPKRAAQYLKKKEKEMYDCVDRMAFERAAELRDEIKKIEQYCFFDPS